MQPDFILIGIIVFYIVAMLVSCSDSRRVRFINMKWNGCAFLVEFRAIGLHGLIEARDYGKPLPPVNGRYLHPHFTAGGKVSYVASDSESEHVHTPTTSITTGK